MDWQGLRVLVVEDHDFQRRTLMRLLQGCGADVHGAENGTTALEWLSGAGQIDVVITDIDMPEMDGIELIRNLAERRDARAVIIASGLEQPLLHSVEAMARGYGLQVLGNIEKPLTTEHLARLVSRYEPVPPPTGLSWPDFTMTRDDVIEALDAGEFQAVFQPKVECLSGQLIGAEALARWSRPGLGVTAAAFIPRIEAFGCIGPLTELMLSAAARQRARWAEDGLPLSISVNVSVHCLSHVSVADRFEQLVREAGTQPQDIVLELTESAVVPEAAHALDVLTRLRLKGFGLSVDDFGTGYSSLKQLNSVPFSELKIDRAFVHGACDNIRQQTLLLGGIDLGRRLKLTTVAEGIETRQEWDLVKALGCDVGQGYFLSRPLSPADFRTWAADWRAMLD